MNCQPAPRIDVVATEASPNNLGWYVYGIISRKAAADVGMELAAASDSQEAALLLTRGEVAVVARRVEMAEMGASAIRARLHDASWLEAIVRGHQRMVEVVQQVCTVLPAKFATVYPDLTALDTALALAHDKLLAALGRLEGCEEWGMHVYADRHTVEKRVAGQSADVRHLQQELLVAKPGAAYFLVRKVSDALAAATSQALSDLAQESYDRLSHHSVAGEITPQRETRADQGRESEILHCAFLVRRSERDSFLRNIQLSLGELDGLRYEYSGPWAPYSFAQLELEAAR